MITFRDGPTGRRAGVIAGPDLWEVAMWIDDLGAVADPWPPNSSWTPSSLVVRSMQCSRTGPATPTRSAGAPPG
jgi:hypothetical protein